MTPSLEYICTLYINFGPRQTFGRTKRGFSRFLPITGGRSISGSYQVHGEVLPGGGEWGLVRPDGMYEAVAKFTIRVEDGTLINVRNDTLLWLSQSIGQAFLADADQPGDAIALSGDCYGRSVLRFDVQPGQHELLNQMVFVGDYATYTAGRTILTVYGVVGLPGA